MLTFEIVLARRRYVERMCRLCRDKVGAGKERKKKRKYLANKKLSGEAKRRTCAGELKVETDF